MLHGRGVRSNSKTVLLWRRAARSSLQPRDEEAGCRLRGNADAAGRHRAVVPSGGSGAASEKPGLRAYLCLEGFSSFTVDTAVESFSIQKCARDRGVGIDHR